MTHFTVAKVLAMTMTHEDDTKEEIEAVRFFVQLQERKIGPGCPQYSLYFPCHRSKRVGVGG
jgi:hypothetical protein